MQTPGPSIPLKQLHGIMPGGKTKLLMSFGGADAFQFVCWLRLALYEQYQFTKTNHIYLDTYGLLDRSGTVMSLSFTNQAGGFERGALSFKGDGTALFDSKGLGANVQGPDTEAVARAKAAVNRLATARGGSVGSMNAAWDEVYGAAMAQARTMMFIVTPAWLKSAFCALEFNQYRELLMHRPCPGIVITFRDDPYSRRAFEHLHLRGAKGASAPSENLRILTLERKWAISGPKRLMASPNMRDLFTLTDSAFRELLAWMPPLRNSVGGE